LILVSGAAAPSCGHERRVDRSPRGRQRPACPPQMQRGRVALATAGLLVTADAADHVDRDRVFDEPFVAVGHAYSLRHSVSSVACAYAWMLAPGTRYPVISVMGVTSASVW